MISVVISAFNNTQFIDECLNSVIESCEGIDYEILLGVDNCKKTIEHLNRVRKNYPNNLKIFFFKKNVGTYIVRNSLVSISNFEKVVFFDSDDVMRKVLIPEINKSLGSNDIVQYGYHTFENRLQFSTKTDFRVKGVVPHVGSFAIKKNIFIDSCGFEPWTCAADGEFIWRMKASGKKHKVLNMVGIFYRKHTNNLTVNPVTGMQSPLRKFYHNLRNSKQRANRFEPLESLEVSDFIELKNNIEEISKFFVDRIQPQVKLGTKDLSIIIPTFENIEYLDSCFSSILKSIKDLECEILVGIDSCNKTLDFIKNKEFDRRFSFRFFSKKVGPYTIRNSLAVLSNSENILFFDSDDIMLENMIPDVLYSLSKFSLYKPMYDDFRNDEDVNKISPRRTNTFGEGVFGIKKELFMSYNGFEPWYCAADSDFMARLYSKNVSLITSRNTVFLRRIHQKSLTMNPETNYSSKLRAHYYGLSKRKNNKNVKLDELNICDSKLIDVTYKVDSNLEKYQAQKNKVDELMNKISINSKPKEKPIDYNKINEIIQRKGVYNPESSKKPIRQNLPPKRQELIELKKGSMNEQLRKSIPGKPNRRNNLPNIF